MQHNNISERLKILRNELELSQTDFGRKIGKNYHSVMRWELGRVSPPANVLEHICSTFGVSFDWIIRGEGDIFSDKKPEHAAEKHAPYTAEKSSPGMFGELPPEALHAIAGVSSSPPAAEGDMLIYTPCTQPDEPSLYMVTDIYGDTHARWFSRKHNTWISKRPDFPDLEFDQAECFGKIVKIIRQIKF